MPSLHSRGSDSSSSRRKEDDNGEEEEEEKEEEEELVSPAVPGLQCFSAAWQLLHGHLGSGRSSA